MPHAEPEEPVVEATVEQNQSTNAWGPIIMLVLCFVFLSNSADGGKDRKTAVAEMQSATLSLTQSNYIVACPVSTIMTLDYDVKYRVKLIQPGTGDVNELSADSTSPFVADYKQLKQGQSIHLDFSEPKGALYRILREKATYLKPSVNNHPEPITISINNAALQLTNWNVIQSGLATSCESNAPRGQWVAVDRDPGQPLRIYNF